MRGVRVPGMWKHASDQELYDYFEGENIWSKEWKSVGYETVLDPNYGTERRVEVWETELRGNPKKFIASEVSNGCWMFLLPDT